MKNKRVLLNGLSSVLIYGILLVLNLVASRYILVSYGSETNGFLSSVNQIFAYIALLEAGIGTATITALYKPLSINDKDNTANVLAASKHYYRTSAKWYALCVAIISFIWPFVIETSLSYVTVWGVIFFQGVSGVITFYYSSTIVNYLVASGHNYVNNNVHVITTVLTYVVKLAISISNLNIVAISISMVGINVLKCILYRSYIRKKLPEFFEKRDADLTLLKQRNSFLIHEISGVIFYGTDTLLISVFCGLTEASVYAVYSMVVLALRNIIGQAFNGTNYVLGKAYSKSLNEYTTTHDKYNVIYIIVSFAIYSIAYTMLIPFVRLYTAGIGDANYLDFSLPILFILIELISSCRIVDNQLIKNAQHAKQTINRTIIEAALNLGCSLFLVHIWGMHGVLCGTIIALMYRTNDIIWYANRKLLNRWPWKEYCLYVLNFLMFILFAVATRETVIIARGYAHIVLIAAFTALIVVAFYGLVNLLVYGLVCRCVKRK